MSTGSLPGGSNLVTNPTIGGMVLIGTFSAVAGASIDCAVRNQGGYTGPLFQADFDNYYFDVQNLVNATASADLLIRMSTNGGVSYDAAANYGAANWAWINGSTGYGGANSGLTAIPTRGLNDASNSPTQGGFTGFIQIYNPLASSQYKRTVGKLSYWSVANTFVGVEQNGMYQVTTPVNAIQFLAGVGNITGTVLAYARTKANITTPLIIPAPIAGTALLGTYTASAAASLPVVTRNAIGQSGPIFQADYNNYEVLIESVVNGTAASFVKLRASTNGGSTYDTGANYDSSMLYYRGAGSGIGGGVGQTMFHLSVAPPAGLSANVAGGGSAKFTIFNPLSATRYKQIHGRMIDYETANAFISYDFQGAYISTTPMNAFQIFPDVGTFTITLYVYGYGK